MTALIIVAVIAVIVIYVISTYNRFISLSNQADEAYSQIDAHLKQRYDLIPNLVETVKGYASHESKTLESVITARNKAMSANTSGQREEAEKELTGTLKTLFALSESYPDLKANTSFLNLQEQLSKIETELLQARKYYNAVVKTFNTSIQTFPNSLVASIGGGRFTKKDYLEVAEQEKQNVKVSFS